MTPLNQWQVHSEQAQVSKKTSWLILLSLTVEVKDKSNQISRFRMHVNSLKSQKDTYIFASGYHLRTSIEDYTT